MKEQLLAMIAKAVGSRKAVATIAAALLNVVVMLLLRFGVEVDDATKKVIEDALSHVTSLVVWYVLGQSAVDVAGTLGKDAGGKTT